MTAFVSRAVASRLAAGESRRPPRSTRSSRPPEGGNPDNQSMRQADLEQAFRARLVAAEERERARIARDLHDVVGQALLAVRLNLVGLHAAPDRAAPAEPAIAESLGIVDEALAQVRTAAFDLRAANLDSDGLGAAVRDLCRQVSRRSGIPIDCQVGLHGERLPAAVEATCYRILQEAMSNAVRHAQAHRIRVRLGFRGSPRALVLEVCDCGVGFDVTACDDGSCFGLTAMRERAALVGGSVSFRSSPGKGTTVQASFRVARQARSAA